MPGGVPPGGRGGLGAFGRYVVLVARTARCAGVRGHRTRRVLAALEVAVLGAFVKRGFCARAGRCRWSWRSVLKRGRTGCVEERCPARCGLGPDRRAARCGRPRSVPLGGPWGPLLGAVRPARRPGFRWMRAAVCALAGTIGAPLDAPVKAGIRLRAASLPSGVQFGADNLGGCVRRRSSCSVRPALLTGVALDAVAQGGTRR